MIGHNHLQVVCLLVPQSHKGIDEESKVIDNITSAGTTAANQWIGTLPHCNHSLMYSVDMEQPAENLNEVVEFPQRLWPSAFKALPQELRTQRKEVPYSKGNILKTQVDTLKSKIPGLSKTLPATYDTWGREVKRNDTTGQAIIG